MRIRNNSPKAEIRKVRMTNIAKRIFSKSLRFAARKLNWQRLYLQDKLLKPSNLKVYCPIAQQEFHSFPKDITITNGARSRHRLFWLFLERETDVLKGNHRVLHCAPQWGIQKRMETYANLDYIPGDKFMPGYDYYEGVVNIDLLDLDFEDNSFDYIICNRVMEHIPDDMQAYTEMYRTLKQGGIAYISVPMDLEMEKTHEAYTDLENRIRYYGQWDHVRMYGKDIKDRIESVGFKVEFNTYSDQFNEEEFRKYGLTKDTIIIAKKP